LFTLLDRSAIQLFFTDDNEILKVAGMDGYMFLRFLKTCAKILSTSSLFGLIILLPVYFTGKGNDNVFGINRYSMANLQNQSDRLWASWIFTYVFSFIFLYFFHDEYHNFAVKRKEFFKKGDELFINPQTNHTVQVNTVPYNKIVTFPHILYFSLCMNIKGRERTRTIAYSEATYIAV